MRKVFISSVVSGFEEYRQAAKQAVEIMGDKPKKNIVKATSKEYNKRYEKNRRYQWLM